MNCCRRPRTLFFRIQAAEFNRFNLTLSPPPADNCVCAPACVTLPFTANWLNYSSEFGLISSPELFTRTSSSAWHAELNTRVCVLICLLYYDIQKTLFGVLWK